MNAISDAPEGRFSAACASLARRAGLETLAVRIAEATPTLMIFGPVAALLFLVTAALAELRWAPGA